MAEIEDPWNSRPIDVHRWSDHPEVREFVDRVWEEYLPEEVVKSGPKPKTTYRNQLRVLLLDLYVAWLEDPELCIGVSMSVNAWNTNSRYNAIHLSKSLLPIIRTLTEKGLIDMAKGSYSGPHARGNRTTRIRASETLQEWFLEVQVTRDDIGRAEGEEIIILRGKPDELLEYEDNEETNRMRAELAAYNEVISRSFIDIPILEHSQIDDITTDHHHKFTRRVFSRGDWRCNGRFYGGWWQRVNSDWRKKIFINDTPAVEVDFRGLHVALLRLKAGALPSGDPYEAPSGVMPGYPDGLVRKFIKRLALTAINADSKDSAYRAIRDGYPANHPGKRLTNEALDRLLEVFLKNNSCLEGYLFSDQGIHLMYEDSLISEQVHRHFTEQGVPVLSIHDSYLIDYTRVAELKRVMATASREVCGVELDTANEYLGLDEDVDMPPYVIADYMIWRQTERCPGYLRRLQEHQERTGVELVPYGAEGT